MGDLTKNFSISEFAQRDPYRPVPAKYRPNVLRLANQLQPLRDVVGRIVITGCYRTLAHNTEIGGADKSQHLTAKAADFTVPGVSNKKVYCTILRLIPGSMEQGGLGWYGEKTATRTPHIHYDVRGFKRRWNKTSGPLPVCPEIAPAPVQEEEDDDMANVLVKKKGWHAVLLTNGVRSWHVPSPTVLGQLRAFGAPKVVVIPDQLFQALWDRTR